MSTTFAIELDRTSAEPLYRQVETGLRRAIDAGRLRPGQRVPSVRALAGQLGVGRLTIATAYEQLAAEGYLIGRMGFGTVVAPHPPERVQGDGPFGPRPAPPRATAARMPALRLLPDPPGPARATPDIAPRFDLRAWSTSGISGSAGTRGPRLSVGPALERLLREEWREVAERGGAGGVVDPAGDGRLRAAIATHVRSSRGARCEPEQVVVLSGAVIGVGAVARLWLGPERAAVVEEPGDPIFRRALAIGGGPIRGVPTDANGIRPDELPDEAAVAVVAPTVHSPTGAHLPLARRLRLLAWASGAGAIVLEDGRADDLLLRGATPICLQGIDEDGRVVHLGAFESLLHDGMRLAYAIVPAALVDPFVAALDALDPGASPVQQRALGRFLADGLLDRHLGRVRRALLDRQEALVDALDRDLGWLVEVRPATGGTRLVATIQDPAWTADGLIAAAESAGVALDSLAAWRSEPADDRDLVLDFGRHEPFELRAAVRAIARVVSPSPSPLSGRPRSSLVSSLAVRIRP